MIRDIELQENGDIVWDGDIHFVPSQKQHQEDLLLCANGDYKSAPDVGVELQEYLDDETPAEMIRKIRKEFARDGMKVQRIEYNNSKLRIDANY